MLAEQSLKLIYCNFLLNQNQTSLYILIFHFITFSAYYNSGPTSLPCNSQDSPMVYHPNSVFLHSCVSSVPQLQDTFQDNLSLSTTQFQPPNFSLSLAASGDNLLSPGAFQNLFPASHFCTCGVLSESSTLVIQVRLMKHQNTEMKKWIQHFSICQATQNLIKTVLGQPLEYGQCS